MNAVLNQAAQVIDELTDSLKSAGSAMAQGSAELERRASLINELEGRLDEAKIRNGHLLDRIQQLEVVCGRLVKLVEDTEDNTEGRYPGPEPSCNECTGGCTPIQYDKGLCALHQAKKLLRQS